jgi:hypothetical protein
MSDQANTLINKISYAILNPLIALAFAIALIVFLWGMYKYVRHADVPEEREIGQKNMFWGIIGMAIMTSVYGIINVLQSTLTNTLK